MSYNKDDIFNDVLTKFIQQKNIRHPISKKPLSKERRIEAMYNIVINRVYGKKYTKDERLLAAELIKEIIKE